MAFHTQNVQKRVQRTSKRTINHIGEQEQNYLLATPVEGVEQNNYNQ